jgi:galactokinase/mevalonate kinase-like predicted kinase
MVFRQDSNFSADDLKQLLKLSAEKSELFAAVIEQAQWYSGSGGGDSMESLVFPRIIHTLGSAVNGLSENDGSKLNEVIPGLSTKLSTAQRRWLKSIELGLDDRTTVKTWCQNAQAAAFRSFNTTMLSSGKGSSEPPKNSLRQDEIVWGRAPARFDTGGGWTDTPPYSLEHGGTVVNIAVNLNGQPPIQTYARVVDEPVVRISSIDQGARIEITELDELLDYRKAESSFGLAKAAIALCGFSPESDSWSRGRTLRQMLEQFGGGIEITTLAAIPKGSGLGTSSIVGAVLIAVIKKLMGQDMTRRELFNAVLKLEQALTTGGGWQDQIGGAVGGVKIISTDPGLVPDARISYLPPDVVEPVLNGGQTLLFYTGITRLAKNILEKVVGKYLDRQRDTMATLKQIGAVGLEVAEAVSRKDIKEFGSLVDKAWKLNIQLDPDSTNAQVEEILARIRPHVWGAKLLGAGGGGFLLMVCKSIQDAEKIKKMLTENPPNERARFFDYSVNTDGLVVTVS